MARRGRPRSERAANAHIVHIKLRLYPGEDDDLMAFFDAIPSGLCAAMVKKALRTGMQSSVDQQGDLDEGIQDALDALVV